MGSNFLKIKMDLKSKTICSDAGRSKSGIAEHRDCTIRALAASAGIPYEYAHKIGREAGRKNGHGFCPKKLLKYAKKEYGITYKKKRYKNVTIQRFIKENPTGRYYVATNKHAFAIINGTIYDTGLNRPLQRLEEVYLMSNNRLTYLRETQSF
jgi:hypothetical protein